MEKENNVTVSKKEPNDEVYKRTFANSPVVNPSVISHYEHVNHPSHYNNYSKEVIDMMENIWGTENLINFCEMNAFKYRMRMGTKPDNSIEQDLKKEKWYLNKAKELKEKLQEKSEHYFSKAVQKIEETETDSRLPKEYVNPDLLCR